MATYRESGVVLRTQKLGESDRIVTVLTRGRGRVRMVARGVRRTSSRIGGRMEPFSLVDIQCYEGRSLDSVTQVETISSFGARLTTDYQRWTAGQAMLETAERLTSEEGEPAVQQFLLLVAGLRSLTNEEHEAGLILDSFLLRSLSVAGWAPTLYDCSRCGDPGPHRAFHPGVGGAICTNCRQPGYSVPAEGTLELMGALLEGEWATADGSTSRQRRDAAGLTSAYLQWQLERNLRSLPLVER
jgi:DNA repair protein RecO (recombination protein O)